MPALERLYPRLFAIVVLAVAFVALTIAITAGVFASLDHQVAEAMHSIWQESLQGLFQLIAELGGLELTTALMLGLLFYLRRGGFGSDSFVVLAFVGGNVLELAYKVALYHPGPPRASTHRDGPSVTDLLTGGGGLNSFPSGHVVRAVIAYGLIAFVVRRLAPWALARAVAVPIAMLVIVAVAFDRLYLDVHWESDVIGGLLLGAIALVAATVWLDRPVKPDN